jgi:DNA-binding SARP family transcriptional activator
MRHALGPDRARLSLLGTFDFTIDAKSVRLPLTAQRLLAFLGLEGPVDRQTAAGRLWPDTTDARAAASLRTALSKVQSLCSAVVLSGGTHLSLATSVIIDVRELREVAGNVIAGNGSAMQAARRLLELRGELLPSWDEEWLAFEREELQQIHLQALESCSERLSHAGHFAPAMMLAYEAIRTDPLRESALRRLIQIHLAQGNRVQALDVYRAFERQLWQDYHVRPSSMLQELMRVRSSADDRQATTKGLRNVARGGWPV